MTSFVYNRHVCSSIVSAFSERAASCTRIGEENSIEVAHIATTFVRIVFSLVCSTLSYSIELVTIVLPQHISRMSAFSKCPCRLVTRPSLSRIVEPNIYWCLRLFLACSSACLTDHSCPDVCVCTTCLLISRVSECELEAFICYLIQLHLQTDRHQRVCRMYSPILGNAFSDRPSHLLRRLLISCSSFTIVLVG